ncbi:MAG: hypothetical protein E6H60_06155 [Betaproteobacteria bacterium]|nr:MAG: hypothetical protein E6H60_06155 [Betaproteobacteria bacterium]
MSIAGIDEVKIMTRIYYCVFATLLMCGACSNRTAPHAPPAATTEAPTQEMGIEARAVLGKLPAPGSEGPSSLRPRYPDKAAFLADLQTTHPGHAVELDGKSVWSGFGPALQYRSNTDGSITR